MARHFQGQMQEAALAHPCNHPQHRDRIIEEVRMFGVTLTTGLLHNDMALGKGVPSMSKHKTLAALQDHSPVSDVQEKPLSTPRKIKPGWLELGGVFYQLVLPMLENIGSIIFTVQ